MESRKQQQASCSKSSDIVAPMTTLAQSDSDILVGTLVWGKFKDWPWWPGLIVTNADVGWSISKKKNVYCILWLGPNKTASRISKDKLSDFLDQNLNSLMDQLIGVEEEQALCEALRGLMSQVLNDKELEGNLSFQEIKLLAVQTQIEREEMCGRKQVVLEGTSCWFERAIDSLRSAVAVKEGQSSSTSEIGPQQGWITQDSAEFAVSAVNYSADATPPPPIRKKKTLLVSSQSSRTKLQCHQTSTENYCSKPECEIQCICANLRRKRKVPERFSEFLLVDKGADRPPCKKLAKKFAHLGALTNKSDAGDGGYKMRKFLRDEKFLRLDLPKLLEEEKMRASDEDVDLTINRTSEGHRKIQLVAWIRFRSLYQSGKIHIRVCGCYRSTPITLVMKPTDVVAAYDDTSDILDMKHEPGLSDVVKKLLDPPEETSLYAFLVCDGLNWRLIGSFNPESFTPPLLKPEEVAHKSLPIPSSSEVRKKPRNKMTPSAIMPEVILEECSLPEEFESELNNPREKRL